MSKNSTIFLMIAGELQECVSPRGNYAATELERLRYRAGGGLPDFDIWKHYGIANCHSREERFVALRAQEVYAVGQILRMLYQQISHRAVYGDRNRRRRRGT